MNLFIHTINKPSESQRVQCDRDRIRTYDRLLRRQMLYPAELRDQNMRRDWDSNPGNVYTLTD